MLLMAVSFRSPFQDVAITLFCEAFEVLSFRRQETAGQIQFLFDSDEPIRNIRGWCADAFGCGLITAPNITVENYDERREEPSPEAGFSSYLLPGRPSKIVEG